MTRRWTIMAAAALALAASLQAASAQDAPNTEISGAVSLWTWPHNDRTLTSLLPEFNKAYPNIKVRIQGFPSGNNAYLNKLLSALLAGTGPDIAMVEINNVAQLSDKQQFADLSKPPFNAGALKAEFAPFAWSKIEDPATGRIFALPKHTGPGGVFYRRDLFAAAGLPGDPQALAATLKDWDAFIEAGKKIAKPNERWMVGTGNELVRAYIAQHGVSYFDKDGGLQVGGPVFRQAFELVAKARDAGLISPFAMWTPEWQGAFARGQIATIVVGNWFGGLLKSAYAPGDAGKWGVVPAPAAENGVSAFNWGGDFLGVLETSKNKDAAWALVKWIAMNDTSLKLQYEKGDLYPAYMQAGTAPWINFQDPYYDGQNANEIFAKVQAEMVPQTTNPLDAIASQAVETAVNAVVTSGKPIDAALAQAEAEIKAKM